MGREIKRVALDFDWPVGKIWPGNMIGICTESIGYAIGRKDADTETICTACRHFGRLAGILDDPKGCPQTGIKPPAGEGWQLWETVSEGSPITPVYATAEELIDHMSAGPPSNLPRDTGWSREVAEKFVKGDGWAPSGVIVDGRMMDGVTGIVEIDSADPGDIK